MRTAILTVLLLLAAAPARAQEGAQPPPALDGTLTLYVIPPAGPLNWTTPQTLINSTAASQWRAYRWQQQGVVLAGHPIGHVHVEVYCSKNGQVISIPITGMTSDENPDEEFFGGMGILFEHYVGRFDRSFDARADVNLRRTRGLVAIMKFPLMWQECVHLQKYLNGYRAAFAQLNYGSQFRPRGWVGWTGAPEGGGCATFGASFIDVAGLLPRSYMTTTWAQQVVIGLSRIGGDPAGAPYPYGSNLVAHHRGWFLSWPAGAPIPKSGWIRPWGLTPSPFLASWYTVTEWTMSQVVPLTLYDPALWFGDIANLHNAAWNGASNGWYATWDQSAPVIIRERGACPTPALKPLVDNVRDLQQ